MNKFLAQDEVDALLNGLSGGDLEVEAEEENSDGVVLLDRKSVV